jgi:hypothetical protein
VRTPLFHFSSSDYEALSLVPETIRIVRSSYLFNPQPLLLYCLEIEKKTVIEDTFVHFMHFEGLAGGF